MKKVTAKNKNRRIEVSLVNSENQSAMWIRFKRLISKSEIPDFEKHKTTTMKIYKNVVITDLVISIEAAESLYALLEIQIKNHYLEK